MKVFFFFLIYFFTYESIFLSFFKKKIIYLFWLHRVLVAALRILLAACGLLSCGM